MGTDLMQDTIFVGMDVHKATISIAVAGGARGGEVRQLGNFLNRADHVGKLVERLSKTGGQRLRFCYEAGPCGYGLHRQITALGHECVVVAPSLIPMKAGTACRHHAKTHEARTEPSSRRRFPAQGDYSVRVEAGVQIMSMRLARLATTSRLAESFCGRFVQFCAVRLIA
jgi:transposase